MKKINKKYVVWDLFGGGQNSVYNSIKKHRLLNKFNVFTFDITKPTRKQHIKLDLTQNNIVDIMKKYPKPDIIVSSTLCQSFSCILNMKGGGTCFWKLDSDKNKLVFRKKEEFEKLKSGFTKHLDADTQLYIAKLGKKCIDNTIELIKYFKPKYWYIENPKHSLIWKYIKLNRKDFYDDDNCFINEASYGKYGYLITKPTYFLSNVKMNLKKGKIEPPYFIKVDEKGQKWYVLKDNQNTKLRANLDSRMLGISSIKTMIKARTAKSGLGGLDFVMTSQKSISQKNKKTTEQISEAGPASAIPDKLIKEIFNYFV